MRIPAFNLATKIFSIAVALMLFVAIFITLIFEREITKNSEYTIHEFIDTIAQNMQTELTLNYKSYQDIRKNLPHKGTHHDFWLDIVDNTVSHLTRNFYALILDQEGNIIAPSTINQNITLSMRKQGIANSDLEADTVDTDTGRTTFITKTLLPNKYYLSIYFFHKDFDDVLWAQHIKLLGIVILIIAIGLILSIILSRNIVKPLQNLNQAALLLPTADITSDKVWQHLPNLPLNRHDEIGTLANSFYYMIDTLQKNVNETLRLTIAKEKTESELLLARTIQQNILPKSFLDKPLSAHNDNIPPIHGLVLPAREVGGDLFDVFWVDEDCFCFAIGDVSDKGVPAALFMGITITLIRVLMRQNDIKHNPAKAMKYINNHLCENNASNMFVTLVIGVFNCKSGKLVFANAGHMSPICMQHDSLENLPSHKQVAIGNYEDIQYKNIEHQLKAGSRIFLYTDGFSEATNQQGQRLGTKLLHDIILQAKKLNPKEFNDYIINEISLFNANSTQYDDIALLNFVWDQKSNEII